MAEDFFVRSNRKSEYPVAKFAPKWRLDISGLLVNLDNPQNVLIRQGSKWRSATKQEMRRVSGL